MLKSLKSFVFVLKSHIIYIHEAFLEVRHIYFISLFL